MCLEKSGQPETVKAARWVHESSVALAAFSFYFGRLRVLGLRAAVFGMLFGRPVAEERCLRGPPRRARPNLSRCHLKRHGLTISLFCVRFRPSALFCALFRRPVAGERCFFAFLHFFAFLPFFNRARILGRSTGKAPGPQPWQKNPKTCFRS